MRISLERVDGALFSAFALAAAMACWSGCLLLNDGALLLSVGWLGNAWDLYFSQFPDRAVSLLLAFGPAWAARALFGLPAPAYIVLAHALFYAVPALLWLVLRRVEPHRAFSRSYLAMVLALVFFPSELIVGAGLWTLWLAIACTPGRHPRAVAAATLVLGMAMAFTHPGTALMTILFVVVAGALHLSGRPVPRPALTAALGLAVLLLTAFVASGRFLGPSNPTIAAGIAAARGYFVDPLWQLSTMARFPALAALWLLLLAPGLEAARLRWRIAPWALWLVAAAGLWFAVNGTGFLFYLYARYSAGYVLALALALAVAGRGEASSSRRALPLFAMVGLAAAASHTVDVSLFGRYVDQHRMPGIVDADRATPPWPTLHELPYGTLIPFKWLAGADYVRDVVVPDYGRYRWSLAFYSYFRSGRRGALYHALPAGEWVPFDCAALERNPARDDDDRRFMAFLGERYCVRTR
jgi:hypothetical protein